MMMHTKLYHLALVALLLTGGPQEASAQGENGGFIVCFRQDTSLCALLQSIIHTNIA